MGRRPIIDDRRKALDPRELCWLLQVVVIANKLGSDGTWLRTSRLGGNRWKVRLGVSEASFVTSEEWNALHEGLHIQCWHQD